MPDAGSLPPAGQEAAGSTPAASSPRSPAADPDAALARLAAEADQIQPGATDAVARLKAVIRELIEIERAQRREIAALQARPAAPTVASAPRRRSRKKSPPVAAAPAPAAVPGGAAASAGLVTQASGTPTATAGLLFAKRGLKKVHRPGCVFGERIKVADRVYFRSMQEAAAAGYEACKICHPER